MITFKKLLVVFILLYCSIYIIHHHIVCIHLIYALGGRLDFESVVNSEIFGGA